MVDKKFREVRTFSWPNDGHRLSVYLNCYLNVPVREDKFKDYIAAGLETVAAELRAEAAEARGRFLQAQIKAADVATVVPSPEEEREVRRTEKEVDREIARQEKQDAAAV